MASAGAPCSLEDCLYHRPPTPCYHTGRPTQVNGSVSRMGARTRSELHHCCDINADEVSQVYIINASLANW